MTESASSSLHVQEHTLSTAVGTVNVWKKYLAIGFPNIQIVDLDAKEKTKKNLFSSSSAEVYIYIYIATRSIIVVIHISY